MKKKTTLLVKLVLLLGIYAILTFGCKKKDNKDEKDPEPTPTTGTVSDVDGHTYKTIKIGDQWWMAENLKTTKYNDGTEIPFVPDSIAWSNLSTAAYCWYNNEQTTNGSTYGALYNWYAVNSGKLNPTG
jgi:hypothetical protein